MKTIMTNPGEVISRETLFTENPELNIRMDEFLQMAPEPFRAKIEDYQKDHPAAEGKPEKEGHFERFDYQTSVYEDGKTYDKYCNVYLPWCYDPTDETRRYNVIYFQHGNTGDPELFTKPELKELLDRLFLQEGIDPCIMVFTTYYFDVTKDVEIRRTSGDVPAGDGNWPGVKPNFYKEITTELIPAVETAYHTYLTGTSDEEVKQCRDHRLFSGYSRGCVATWYMIHNAFEYYRYFIPMSCITACGKGIRDQVTEEEVIDYVSQPMKDHPELPFFIYSFNGGKNDIPNMPAQIDMMVKSPVFSYGRDPKKNNFYHAITGYFHGDFFAPQYYFNALPVMFTK